MIYPPITAATVIILPVLLVNHLQRSLSARTIPPLPIIIQVTTSGALRYLGVSHFRRTYLTQRQGSSFCFDPSSRAKHDPPFRNVAFPLSFSAATVLPFIVIRLLHYTPAPVLISNDFDSALL